MYVIPGFFILLIYFSSNLTSSVLYPSFQLFPLSVKDCQGPSPAGRPGSAILSHFIAIALKIYLSEEYIFKSLYPPVVKSLLLPCFSNQLKIIYHAYHLITWPTNAGFSDS